jgi:hypothetical protein
VRVVSPSDAPTPSPTSPRAGAAPAAARPSHLIAEALVQRHGPCRIVDRASRLGLPAELTRAMVAACGATAVDPTSTEPPPASLQ